MNHTEPGFVPHGVDSPEVKARLEVVHEVAMARHKRVTDKIAVRLDEFGRRIGALVRSDRPLDERIPELWKIADEIGALTEGNVACKRGCSHCCHIAVGMSAEEAEVIGKRIGVAPRQIEGGGNINVDLNFDWGYHNPCTFLKDGECSIYENRPLACRTHYSLDVDSLLCELTPPESCPLPMLNPMYAQLALLRILGVPKRVPVVEDIRAFFPRGKND